jgi:DNA-binding NarL/FixJ family response regulator
MICVLLVDDHPVVRSGYHRLLEQSGGISVVAECGDADSALKAHAEHAPDVCVTDLALPDASGMDLIRRILVVRAQARILVFSMYDSLQVVRQAMRAGASGFVSKHASPDSLVEAVRVTHDGGRYLSAGLAPALRKGAPDDEASRIASLSQREYEIFRLLAAGRSAIDCARLLNVSAKTVANCQTLIKQKLSVSTSAALVHLALRNGVISPCSSEPT